MAMLLELKRNRADALAKADHILKSAESANRALTDSENADVDTAMAEAEDLRPRIATIEKQNTLSQMMRGGVLMPMSSSQSAPVTKLLSADYSTAFHAWVTSGGQSMGGALYEGANSQGGFAVPITVDGQIVPLAPPETGVRQVATVLGTTNDIKIPRKATGSTATAKTESGTTVNSFTESGPTLDEFTLSAFMAGVFVRISFELAQDVPAFQAFAISDMMEAQQQLEEGWFISGSGVNQAQGLLGNVGAGVTEQPDASGNLVTIDGTLDLIGTLNAVYHENASFLMARTTSIILRKAQRQSNLFEPVWTRSNGRDFLNGYPVQYSAAMPTAARGATPVLFGDFRQGYVIGDRGGSPINVKVLDQPLALQGQIALLAYRRTDGRVRRSEAIQSYTVATS